MKLCRQMVHKKRQFKEQKNFVFKATVSVPDPFQGFYNVHFICLSVDEIN